MQRKIKWVFVIFLVASLPQQFNYSPYPIITLPLSLIIIAYLIFKQSK